MDRTEEDMRHLGFVGIFTHSFKTIIQSHKLFTQITLTFILPLTLIFIAHMEISHHFFQTIDNNYIPYDSTNRTITLTDWAHFWLFKILYFTFLTLFSLLSTAAVVFSIAAVYSGRDVIFRRLVTKVVPKVWKKLCVTFVFIYFALFFYNVISGVIMFFLRSIVGYSVFGSLILFILLILYVIGLLYLILVWQLASAITVLENLYGFKAMKKGKNLANGKKKVGMGIGFVFYVIFIGLILVYQLFVEFGGDVEELAMIWRVLIGISCGFVLMMLFLLFIVVQTVLYLVCKSYHREAIDRLSLSTFLSAYTEETVVYPKPGEEIQLGRTQGQEV